MVVVDLCGEVLYKWCVDVVFIFGKLNMIHTSNTPSTNFHTCTGSVPFFNAHFGHGTGPILLDDLLCTGSEARLIDCPRSISLGIGTYDFCPNGHGEDAGVRCLQRKWFSGYLYLYALFMCKNPTLALMLSLSQACGKPEVCSTTFKYVLSLKFPLILKFSPQF